MKRIINGELITVTAVMGVAILAMSLLGPILPLYLTSVGVSPATLGLMLSTAMVGMVIGESAGGLIADRVGIKLPLAVGTFLCAPLVLAFVFVRSVPVTFLVFFLWGTIRATVFGPGRGYIGSTVPFSNKAMFMGVYATTMALARSAGSFASGFIADNLSYDWNFYASAAVSIVGGIIIFAALRKVPLIKSMPREEPASVPGNPVASRRPDHLRPFVIQSLVAALFFLPHGLASFLPLLATQVVGVKATEVGILFTIGGLVTAALLIPLGRLADRKGKKTLMLAGLVVFATGFAGAAFAQNYAWLIGSVVAYSIGAAMFSPAAVALLSDIVPARWQSSAMGIYGACEDVGVIAGSAAGGVIWTGIGPSAVFVTGAAAALTGALVTLGFVKEKRQGIAEPSIAQAGPGPPT